ncbi:unnamed protein product [Arabis nemorensis]|uniref:Neprosin activation peptide domain-containing protein n=1 Tax=Arabis nemorensis TaxID=586526 RepID=A0A565BWJ2_9BRAS|nr:unnamed protein product [Arabis nemorensis]
MKVKYFTLVIGGGVLNLGYFLVCSCSYRYGNLQGGYLNDKKLSIHWNCFRERSYFSRYEKRRHSNIPAHVSLCFRHKEGLFATLFLLAVFGVATAAAPVSTIHSPDGDVIDCINKLDQPALKHPLLKNHLFQETPTDMVKTNEGFGLQVWHANGASCPDGTIPIRRFEDEISHRKQQNPLVSDAAERATKGHEASY